MKRTVLALCFLAACMTACASRMVGPTPEDPTARPDILVSPAPTPENPTPVETSVTDLVGTAVTAVLGPQVAPLVTGVLGLWLGKKWEKNRMAPPPAPGT